MSAREQEGRKEEENKREEGLRKRGVELMNQGRFIGIAEDMAQVLHLSLMIFPCFKPDKAQFYVFPVL